MHLRNTFSHHPNRSSIFFSLNFILFFLSRINVWRKEIGSRTWLKEKTFLISIDSWKSRPHGALDNKASTSPSPTLSTHFLKFSFPSPFSSLVLLFSLNSFFPYLINSITCLFSKLISSWSDLFLSTPSKGSFWKHNYWMTFKKKIKKLRE